MTLYHALGLHMHQPPQNLERLIAADTGTAEEIIRCYERVPRYAREFSGQARLHVGFSGILLQQLLDPGIVDRYRHWVDIPTMLASYGETTNIELIGMGYYHPIFPLIPVSDWEEQILSGRKILEQAFGRAPPGFWPPEMAFRMEMIPALVAAGYEYVVVEGAHVRPEDGLNDIYRPYLACRDGVCITVVPRDPLLSDHQGTGLELETFVRTALGQIEQSPRPAQPRLVTTWSDGENRHWFRQLQEENGFFGRFFAPYMEQVGTDRSAATPVALSAYLKSYPPTAHARVQCGSWNAGTTAETSFNQWIGSGSQREAALAIHELSRRYWDLRRQAGLMDAAGKAALQHGRRLILEAETSCFLFWGDAWLPHLYARIGPARHQLEQAERALLSRPLNTQTDDRKPAS